ncbi:hypothetical protein VTP01DRAFT_7439 [Rhizomucor pusillus]|uniref:uncharacterized protein n=1 Tax=Rhizomucor pusillus TaxID=4840 RepID=UPI003742248B
MLTLPYATMNKDNAIPVHVVSNGISSDYRWRRHRQSPNLPGASHWYHPARAGQGVNPSVHINMLPVRPTSMLFRRKFNGQLPAHSKKCPRLPF